MNFKFFQNKNPIENKSLPIRYESNVGDSIEDFVKKLIEISKDKDVIGEFSVDGTKELEIELYLPKGSNFTSEELINIYTKKRHEKFEKYKNSL